jgi:non-canonical (house-cleaning) NTP pyrophosphatase
MIIGVGSKNPSKLSSVAAVVNKIFKPSMTRIVLHETILSIDNCRTLGKRVKLIPSEFSVVDDSNFSSDGLTIIGFEIDSLVSDQPMTAGETLRGARNRASRTMNVFKDTLKSITTSNPGADGCDVDFELPQYCVGLEGGVEQVDDIYLESGYIVVESQSGEQGVGTSARFEIAAHVYAELQGGCELSTIVDRLSSSTDVRSSQGMMGVITNGLLPRNACYEHGVLFAFSRFISPPQYWKP